MLGHAPGHRGPQPADAAVFVILGILVGVAYAFAFNVAGLPVSRQPREAPADHAYWTPGPTAPDEPTRPDAGSAARLGSLLKGRGLDLRAIRAGQRRVPAVLVAAIPPDLGDVADVDTRKALFFGMTLPLVLTANAEVLADRDRLLRLATIRRLGHPLPRPDTAWLHTIADRYGVHDPTDGPSVPAEDLIRKLLIHVDAVPAGLALAQAAEESGWATSRFAREGNALFGQWTWDDAGMVPEDRAAGATHRVRAFDTPLESVRAYLFNLNTHRAYAGFRSRRAELRATGETPSTEALVGALTEYSERGAAYVRTLQAIVAANGLSDLDASQLAEPVIAAR